ncbi:hypothetical protein ACH4YO_13920 [Streptomyces noursei]|uniref:hypothetical protein n=1 Tax=Streptomyces noursei TaxID=1971 RepID=UPI0033FECB1E
MQLRHGRADRVLIAGSAWSTARSALLPACFDDTLCEHAFRTIVGWPRDEFHALAAKCEVLDAEGLRAEIFRARASGDGLRRRKLLTFALDHMDMGPTSRDVESVERGLAELADTCDVEMLTDLLARVRGRVLTSPPSPRRSRGPRSGLRGQRPHR